MPDTPADTPPDRLSLDPRSEYFDEALLSRGVGIKFNGQEKTSVIEYSISEGWIRVAAGKSRDRYGQPMTLKLNGKVERSHRVDAQEFYQLLDKNGITDDIHLFNEKLREWEDYYNYHRPHGALDGETPYERLLAKTRAEELPKP